MDTLLRIPAFFAACSNTFCALLSEYRLPAGLPSNNHAFGLYAFQYSLNPSKITSESIVYRSFLPYPNWMGISFL
jgi:hypothetical protein